MTGGVPLWKNTRRSPTKSPINAGLRHSSGHSSGHWNRHRTSVRGEAGTDLNSEQGIKDLMRAKKDGITYLDPTDGIEITISSAPGGCRYYVAGNARPVVTVAELRRDDTGMFLYFPELERAVAVTARVLSNVAFLFDKCDVKHNIERKFYLKQVGVGYTDKGFSLNDKKRSLAEAEEHYQQLVQQQNMQLGLGVRIHHSSPPEIVRERTPVMSHQTHSVRQHSVSEIPEGSVHSSLRPPSPIAEVHSVGSTNNTNNMSINNNETNNNVDTCSKSSLEDQVSIKSVKSVYSVASSVPIKVKPPTPSSSTSSTILVGRSRISPPRPKFGTQVPQTSSNSMICTSNSPTALTTHVFNY